MLLGALDLIAVSDTTTTICCNSIVVRRRQATAKGFAEYKTSCDPPVPWCVQLTKSCGLRLTLVTSFSENLALYLGIVGILIIFLFVRYKSLTSIYSIIKSVHSVFEIE